MEDCPCSLQVHTSDMFAEEIHAMWRGAALAVAQEASKVLQLLGFDEHE